MVTFAARARATTSAAVRMPDPGGSVMMSDAWFTMQIGARSLAR